MQLSEMDDFLADSNIKELFNDELFLLLKTIATCMNCGIAVGSNSTTTPFVFWNDKATEILGRGPTEQPPENWVDVYGIRDPQTKQPLPPEDVPLTKAMNGIAALNQVILIRNYRLNKDLYVTCNAMPIIKNDIIIGGVVTFYDTTHLQQEVSKIETLNNKIKMMIEEHGQ